MVRREKDCLRWGRHGADSRRVGCQTALRRFTVHEPAGDGPAGRDDPVLMGASQEIVMG
jgi:hypothetical protein